MNIKEFAKEYVPQQMKNIAELEVIRTDIEIKKEVREDQSHEKYTVMFVVINDEEYRVPGSVVGQLKTLLESKPDLASFKVVRTGQGMGTKYQVIPL